MAETHSSSSSTDQDTKVDLSTELTLGPTICFSPAHNNQPSNSNQGQQNGGSLFVKVYMEGNPIGRKLDLFAHESYNALITALGHMFNTTVLCAPYDDSNYCHDSEKHYLLTYQDNEGDWMMAGDVPWEIFLTNVKTLKIQRTDRCS